MILWLGFFLDRILKLLVLDGFGIELGLIKLELIKNFGYFNFSLPEYMALVLSVLAFLMIVFWIWKSKFEVSLMLIFLGGLSNVLDRYLFGYVVDYIHVQYFPFAFNIADGLITLGVILFFLKERK